MTVNQLGAIADDSPGCPTSFGIGFSGELYKILKPRLDRALWVTAMGLSTPGRRKEHESKKGADSVSALRQRNHSAATHRTTEPQLEHDAISANSYDFTGI
jgi:hypothetical protein